MNQREAQEIIRMVESNWRFDLGPARQMWRDALGRFEPEIGTEAVSYLATHSRGVIDLADVVEVCQMLQRKKEPEQTGIPEPEFKRGVIAPEWVWVLIYARYLRDPPCLAAFPQQEGYVDPDGMLSTEQYEEIRSEWLAAGSPKTSYPFIGKP